MSSQSAAMKPVSLAKEDKQTFNFTWGMTPPSLQAQLQKQ